MKARTLGPASARSRNDGAAGARRAVVDLHLVEFIIGARLQWSVTRLRRTITAASALGAVVVAGAMATVAAVVPAFVPEELPPADALVGTLFVANIYFALTQLAWGFLSYQRERLIASPHRALLRAVDGSAAPAALISWLPFCVPVNAALLVAGATLAVASPTVPLTLRLIVVLIPITNVALMISVGLSAATRRRRHGRNQTRNTPSTSVVFSIAIGVAFGALSATVAGALLAPARKSALTGPGEVVNILLSIAPYAVVITLTCLASIILILPAQYARCHSSGNALVRRAHMPAPGTGIWGALSNHARVAAQRSGARRSLYGAILLASSIIGYRAVEITTRCIAERCLADGVPTLVSVLTLTSASDLVAGSPIGGPAPFGEISRAQLAGAIALLAAHATSLNILDGLIRRSGPRATRQHLRLYWELGGRISVGALSVYGACARIALTPATIIGASFMALGVPWAALCPLVALATAAAACLSDAALPQALNSDDTAATDVVVVLGTVACSLPLVAGMSYGTTSSRTIAVIATTLLIGITLWRIARSLRKAPRTRSLPPSSSQSLASASHTNHTVSST